tara:strand:+ start:680 stop:916 length:237 start_codon:yes stop_codon:yes gene_type:complete
MDRRVANLEVEQRRMNSLVRENERLRIQVQQLKKKIREYGVEGMRALEEIGVLLGGAESIDTTGVGTGTSTNTTQILK